MDIHILIEALLLGLLEGLTEFIPVSSTGHILLAGHFLGFNSTGKVFEVLIQLGAILAILSLYAGRFWAFLRRPDFFRCLVDAAIGVLASIVWLGGCAWELLVSLVKFRRPNLFLPPALPADPAVRLLVGVIVAFLPSAVLGVALIKVINGFLLDPARALPVIAATWIVGGIIILIFERIAPKPRYTDPDTLPLWKAFQIGLCQCFSLIPGVSRSGATILGGELLGVERKAAAAFTFYLAVPTMLGASVFELYKHHEGLTSARMEVIGVGFVVSFIVAYVVVKTFIAFIGR